MATETPEKTFWDYHEEIEALKEQRGVLWRAKLEEIAPGDSVHALSPSDVRVAVVRAENDPDVLAIAGQIAVLRAEQLANHAEPSAEESDAYHAAHAAKE